MSRDLRPVYWPRGGLLERRAIFVYEGTRMQAVAVGAPVVPEPWPERDEKFRAQFVGVIAMMTGPDRKSSPEELHDDWMKAYEAMGWVYGEVRDPEKKTHPDMVPFDELEPVERDKDAVFVALCELARQWVIDYEYWHEGLDFPVVVKGWPYDFNSTVFEPGHAVTGETECTDLECDAHGPMLRRIEVARAKGVNEGIRLAAQLINDHTFGSSVVSESIVDFLIERADRVKPEEEPS